MCKQGSFFSILSQLVDILEIQKPKWSESSFFTKQSSSNVSVDTWFGELTQFFKLCKPNDHYW